MFRKSFQKLFRIAGDDTPKSTSQTRRNKFFSSSPNSRRGAIPFSGGADAERLHGEEFNRIHNSGEVPQKRAVNDFFSANKRRDLFTITKEVNEDARSGTGDVLSGRTRRLHDGIDDAGYQPPSSKLTKEERRRQMREALEEKGHSYVAFTEEGAERDFITGGVPQQNRRGSVDGVTISGESSMFSTLIQQKELKSKKGISSWSALERDAKGDLQERRSREEEWRTRNTLHDRQWREDESTYHTDHDDPVLEHAYEAVQHSVSIYTHKKLFMDGLFGVERFITKEEERALCEELIRCTQSPSAAYIPEEGRYCINLYERELGIPSKDPLALSLNKHAPLLMDMFLRAFYVGLIPSIPNLAQVSEFTGAFSGYPTHLKNNSIGPFMGCLSLISPTVMHMTHISSPWLPRLYLRPRSLYVMQQPCLGEYRVGFKAPEKHVHTFRGATRQSKDYRIEILFACVDTRQSPLLRDAVDMTAYASKKLLAAPHGDTPSASPLPDLTSMLSKASDGGEIRDGVATQVPTDGLLLKERALSSGLVGNRPKVVSASTAEMSARIARLKEKEAEQSAKVKELNKFVPTSSSPIVQGKYPDRRRY